MMTSSDEWRIIGASALGGGFGAIVGVFLALISPTEKMVWQVMALRWAVNFCFALCFGPVLAWWAENQISNVESFPGPILSIASGGAAGCLGVMFLQFFLPSIRRWLAKRLLPDDNNPNS